MFVALGLNCVVVAAGAAALADDEPPKTVVAEAITSFQLGDYVNVVDGGASKAATFQWVGAATTPIGIDVQPVDLPLKAHLKLDGGAIVARVVPDSEAAKAGVKIYDVIVGVEGKKVPDVAWLQKTLENPQLGKKADNGEGASYQAVLDLVREAKPVQVELRRVAKPQIALTSKALVEFTGQDLAARVVDGQKLTTEADKRYRLGLSLAEPDDVVRSQLKLAQGQGLVVTQVLPDGPAAKSGVQKNDIVVTFDKAPTKGVDDLTARIQETGDKPAVLELLRAGQKLDIAVRAKKEDAFSVNLIESGHANDVSKIVSDLIILTENDGKRYALTAKPTGDFVTTFDLAAKTLDAAGNKQLPAIHNEIKELRKSVDQLQAHLARLEKEQVVAKLQANVARLEAALKDAESAKGKK